MSKIYISSPSCGGIGTDPRRRFHRSRRRKSKAARARDFVSRLSGAWLMDQQDQFGDTSR
jgi:hypothetical protein